MSGRQSVSLFRVLPGTLCSVPHNVIPRGTWRLQSLAATSEARVCAAVQTSNARHAQHRHSDSLVRTTLGEELQSRAQGTPFYVRIISATCSVDNVLYDQEIYEYLQLLTCKVTGLQSTATLQAAASFVRTVHYDVEYINKFNKGRTGGASPSQGFLAWSEGRRASAAAADAMLPVPTFTIETDEAGRLSAPIR